MSGLIVSIRIGIPPLEVFEDPLQWLVSGYMLVFGHEAKNQEAVSREM